jgi:hypothetical protein
MKPILAAVAAIVTLVLAATAAAGPNFVIRRDNDIGGFQLSKNGTLAAAVDVYGNPSSRHSEGSDCNVAWSSYGIRSQFFVLYIGSDPCSGKACHSQTTVTSSKWKTDKGLRIGDSVQRLHKLYSRARKQTGGNWALISQSLGGYPLPTLLAHVRAGHVNSFSVRSPALRTC